MPRNHNTATTTPEAHAQPQMPELYGFTDAFDETGQDLESIIQSQVSTSPRINYEQAGKKVRAAMNRYTKFSESLFEGVRAANYNRPATLRGRDVRSLAEADDALPGTVEYMHLVRRKLDAHHAAGFKGDIMKATTEENSFMEAMDWAALREQRLAAPQEITPAEYSSAMFSPHDKTPPYDTYEHARDHAISSMINEAMAAKVAATPGSVEYDDAADRARDLAKYMATYVAIPPAYTTDREAARAVGESLNLSPDGKPGPVDPDDLVKMEEQADLDRIFATYDGEVKGRMKQELDMLDQRVLADLENKTNIAQDDLAKESASRMRRMIPIRSAKLENQAKYDNTSALLGAMELRMAQRIGIQNMSGQYEKIAGSGMQADALVATNHMDRAKALDAKILRNLGTRTKGDIAADFWAGKNKGSKETRKTVNFTRRALKVGIFAGMSVLGGPAGFAAAMGVLKAGGKMAEYTSKHANELRTRDMSSINELRALMDIMDQKNAPAIYKIWGSRKMERSGRNKDMLAQQTRMILAYGKTALWGAGVGFAPYYGPTLAHIGLDVADSGWELTKGTYNRF